jgi:hypothetical protein
MRNPAANRVMKGSGGKVSAEGREREESKNEMIAQEPFRFCFAHYRSRRRHMKLMTCVALLSVFAWPAVTFAQSSVVWETIQDLPPGSRLKLVFRNDTEVTGTVVTTSDTAVVLRDNQPGASGLVLPGSQSVSLQANISFPRTEVTGAVVVTMARQYSTDAIPNTESVRYVARELQSANKKIEVRTPSRTVRGSLKSIDQEALVFEASDVEPIAIRDVREIKEARMRRLFKGLIIAGVAYAGLAALYWINLVLAAS